jgi:RimJ/RimL family protein N-acetyltransferase
MNNIKLRKVSKNDWRYILELRNNKKFRSFFYNQHIISEQEHLNYLKKQKLNSKFFNWIICYGVQNAGYIRILDNDISIIIDPKFQKIGIGTKALKLLEIEAKKKGIKKLIGRVMIHNLNSKKIFLKNNYKLKMYWYEKELD